MINASLQNHRRTHFSIHANIKKSIRPLAGMLACLPLLIVPDASCADSTSLEQYIDMDLEQLLEVTVTSVSKKPQLLADTAAAIFVITQEDIKKSGATTIPDALSLAPGIHVAQINAGNWSVSARGFSGFTSNKLLTLIDGRSVYTPAYSGTVWDMQSVLIEDIDRIEVIRGPGGTIWGANAVNGVINIITKSSQETEGGLVRLSTGSHERFSFASRYGGKLSEDTYGRLYLMTSDRDSFELYQSDLDANDGWTNYQAGFRVDGVVREDTNWSVHGDAYTNDGDQTLFPYWLPEPPYLSAYATDLESNGANLTGSVEKRISANKVLKAQAYYDYNDRDQDSIVFDFHTLDLDVQYDYTPVAAHALALGGGYRYISANFDETYQYLFPDSDYQLFSAFMQDEITLVKDTLYTTFGVKWEHNDFTGNEWQPSGRLLYKPAENQSLWFSLARAVRTPAIIEDSGELIFATFPTATGTTGQVVTTGNSDFESEVVYAYEAGYRWQPKESIAFDLAVFFNDYDSLYAIVPVAVSTTEITQTFINALEAESYGFEASVKWRPTESLAFDLAYSYLNFDIGDLSDPTGLSQETSLTSSIFSTTTPEHQVSLHGSWNMTPRLQFNGWLKYQSDTETLDSSTLYTSTIEIDAFFQLDLGISWKPRDNMEFSLVGQNLLDENRLQYVAELLVPATTIEREVYLKFTYSF